MNIITTVFTAATMFFVSACGNNSETATTTTTEQPAQDAAQSANGLMKSMNDMMDNMHAVQMTGDFDVDFANMMVAHHQGGIDMAQVELSQGKDETMKAKAQEIITKQQKEQQELKDFVQGYKPSDMKHGEGDMQKSMAMMMEKKKSMQMSGDVDKDFATMMITHHQDGIDMAKMEVKNGMSAKLKQMAQREIDDQQRDIKEFQSWLSSNK